MKNTLVILCALGAACVTPALAETTMDKAGMMVDHSMKMMDTNADGMISMDERAAACKAMFTATDTNADGMISANEMSAMDTKNMTDMNMVADPAKVSLMVKSKIKMEDANADGMVSMSEEETASKAMFMKADTNKDGSLSKQEMTVSMAKMMPKM